MAMDAEAVAVQGNHMVEPKPHGALCGAKTRAGGACERAPMANGRCHKHGGPSQGGPITTGRRSRRLGKWRESYEAAMEADDLLDLRPGLALLDTITDELVDAAQAGDKRATRRLLHAILEGQKRKEAAVKLSLDAQDVLTRRDAMAFVAIVMSTVQDVAGMDVAARVSQKVRHEIEKKARLSLDLPAKFKAAADAAIPEEGGDAA